MKYLTPELKSQLETFCWDRIETQTRDACLILTALYIGGRASEVLNLTWRDIDREACTIRVKTLKRGRNRTLPVSRKFIERLYCLNEGQERVFSISYERLKQVWNMYRPCKMPFHALRHTFALSTYHRTKDINLVKHVMGHRSLASTTVYLDETYSNTTLKRALGVR